MLRPTLTSLLQDPAATQSPGWLLALFGGEAAAGVWLPGSLLLGTFVTEDLSCVAAGIFAAEERVGFVSATLACVLGIWLGDIGLYLIGRLSARGLLRLGWARHKLEGLSEGTWRRAFDRHGNKILFMSRFLPGTRVPSYLFAGAIGFPLWRFATVLGVAVVIWTPLLVGTAMWTGGAVLSVLERWGTYAWIAVPSALLVVWLLVRLGIGMCSWRGRRLLYGRLRRLLRWEYWPPVLVFPPVVLDLLRLSLVHRTPAVFTACNRAIPSGGLFGESKGDILDLFGAGGGAASGDPDGVVVARYARLRRAQTLDDRMQQVAPFLAAGRCVLKPDQGERGAGVVVVHDEAEARAWLAECPYDAIVQEFVAGEEYGVAWCRDPATGRGRIDSIAHKVLPSVVGDGSRTLEELILADDRAVAMARFHLRRQAGRLLWVPDAGERVALGDLGTHARGATFFDARELATAELHAAFDRLLADVPGIDFGRFDVRVGSGAGLRQGRGVRVLEFNGVTGEAAHVYQPGYPWWRGVRDMIAHMRRATAIGAHNRAAGHAPATMRHLLAVLFGAWRRPAFEFEHAVCEPRERGDQNGVSGGLVADSAARSLSDRTG